MKHEVISDLQKEATLTWRHASNSMKNPGLALQFETGHFLKKSIVTDTPDSCFAEWQKRLRETQEDQIRLLTRIEEDWNVRLAECAAVGGSAASAAREYLRQIEEEIERLLDSRQSKVVAEYSADATKRELAIRDAENRAKGSAMLTASELIAARTIADNAEGSALPP